MRLAAKLRWIFAVSFKLAATPASSAKLFLGGLWFLIFDRSKSRMSVTARLHTGDGEFTLRLEDLGDFGTAYEVFVQGVYGFDLPFEPETVVDLGSNIGCAAIYFALRYPGAAIYCLEPDPTNVERLQRNTEAWPNISCSNVAVWSENGAISFYVDPHRSNSSSVMNRRARQEEIQVEARTLDAVIEMLGIGRVDLLKFDIEGAEVELMAGLSDPKRVRMMIGEIHADLIGGLDRFIETVPDAYVVSTSELSTDRFGCTIILREEMTNASESHGLFASD